MVGVTVALHIECMLHRRSLYLSPPHFSLTYVNTHLAEIMSVCSPNGDGLPYTQHLPHNPRY
jgi:hypothetical protein